MNNDETYTPCTSCGRPMAYCKGQCCGKPKGCHCQEYGPKVCGAIRPIEPTCPYQAVIPSVVVENTSNLKDLADCFAHVTNINTTFYIDDKHRITTIWAGPVEVDLPENVQTQEEFEEFVKSFNLRSQFLYIKHFDQDTNKYLYDAFYFDKTGSIFWAGQFEEAV